MKIYRLEKRGNLLYTTGAVKGKGIVIAAKFLIDTGSNYTVLPVETLIKIGHDPALIKPTVRIIAANSSFVAPKIKVEWIHCLGLKYENFHVLAHTLPAEFYADGVLGMDFLTQAQATIDIANEQIFFSQQ